MGWLSTLNLALYLSGLAFIILIPALQANGSLKLKEQFTYPLYYFAIVPFALSSNYHCTSLYIPLFEQFLLKTLANACFVLALVIQLRANAEKLGEGPTHPKNQSYEGGGQRYMWDEDDEQ